MNANRAGVTYDTAHIPEHRQDSEGNSLGCCEPEGPYSIYIASEAEK